MFHLWPTEPRVSMSSRMIQLHLNLLNHGTSTGSLPGKAGKPSNLAAKLAMVASGGAS